LPVVRLLFSTEARQRWRSWLLIVGLVALTTGLVLAGVSAGRRTASAFPQLVAAHGYDAVAYSDKPLPQIAQLHEVSTVTALRAPASAVPTCACSHPISQEDFNLYVAPSKTISKFVNLVAGTMPDPSDPHQVLGALLRPLTAGHIRKWPHNPEWTDSGPSCGRNRSSCRRVSGHRW
jgi:hypothetical protein